MYEYCSSRRSLWGRLDCLVSGSVGWCSVDLYGCRVGVEEVEDEDERG